MLITKQDGTHEKFNPEKLHRSLKRVGCSEEICEEVITEVEKELSKGDSTSKIYQRAFELLREKEKPLAARYSMKRAVFALGPSGFPFEDFVAEIFRAQGYQASTGKYLQGMCAPHEVDLYALRGTRCIGAEIKFHNRLGTKTDLKVALYVHARFEDIRRAHPHGYIQGGVDEGWLITNTEFTSNAVHYGNCVGLVLIGWTYPEDGNLLDLIEETNVQPITALTTLSERHKRELLSKEIVLCRSLIMKQGELSRLGLTEEKVKEVVKEIRALCGFTDARYNSIQTSE
ncbi:MAG TPA: ATP cone domain-containing protein [Candidatus Paceibacterota bacterium]|jgi:hypothetical protein